jgi:hypothetical protein
VQWAGLAEAEMATKKTATSLEMSVTGGDGDGLQFAWCTSHSTRFVIRKRFNLTAGRR